MISSFKSALVEHPCSSCKEELDQFIRGIDENEMMVYVYLDPLSRLLLRLESRNLYIDKSFYKQKGNCARFITSNTRIHAWISAFGDLIYNKEGNGFDVTWIDKKAENEKIIQTEFVVSNSLDSDDDFLYKIIIYLTTGKILIQGKGWETFCNNKFQACKQLVDNLINKDKKGNDNCVSVISNDNTNTDRN
ncbi:unnamed protein product [Mytilus edulis]|uniref:Uncharacterized protein n=1 Tax=Mytilus edulis TaxID=6550 RepID=A0A8S3UDC3_MYTED|nr:unnamed protein product [Mytilus edulis]